MKPGLILCGAVASVIYVSVQESVAFTYDVHGRLTQVARVDASGPDSTSVYAYDPADNRTSRTITVTAFRAAGDRPVGDPLPQLLDDTESAPIGSPNRTPTSLPEPTDGAGEPSDKGEAQ